jgi:ribose transport system substrate-binding protein
MKYIATWLAIGFAAALSLAAPATAQDTKLTAEQKQAFEGKTVALVPMALGMDLTDGWNAMIKRGLEPLGIKYIVRDPNWSTDAGAQAISSLITDGVNLIVVQNPDVQSYARLLKRAQEKGIYVIQVEMSSIVKTDAYVGINYDELGELMANQMVEKCGPGKGPSNKIAIVQGVLTAAASIERMQGINKVLSKHPEIDLVSNQAADWDASKARAITDTVLRQHPDLCGVIGFWDGMDVGTAAAIREAGKQDQVTLITAGGGEQSLACDNIKNGNFTIYDNADVRVQSEQIVDVIKHLFMNGKKPGSENNALYSQLDVLTKDNLTGDTCWDLKEYK